MLVFTIEKGAPMSRGTAGNLGAVDHHPLGAGHTRALPSATHIARTNNEGILLLEEHRDRAIDELCLDHDLGGDDSIMPVVTPLEEAAFNGRPFQIGTIFVHSANPSGAETVVRVLKRWDYRVRRGDRLERQSEIVIGTGGDES